MKPSCFGKHNSYLIKCHEDKQKAEGCPLTEKCYRAYLSAREKCTHKKGAKLLWREHQTKPYFLCIGCGAVGRLHKNKIVQTTVKWLREQKLI